MKTTRRFGLTFSKGMLGLFILLYLIIFVQIVFLNNYSYGVTNQLLFSFIYIVFVAFVCFIAYKNKTFVKKNKYRILALVLLFVFAVQLYVGFATKQIPVHDYGKVFNGAVMFVTDRANPDFAKYDIYLNHCDNNAPIFCLFQAIFTIMQFLGLSCFYEVAIVIGHLIFAAAFLFTFLYLERAFGDKFALISLLLYVSFAPVYLQSSVAYTDTYSFLTIPLALYLLEHLKTAKSKKSKIILCVLVGLTFAIGAKMKATADILLIAVAAELFATVGFKKALLRLLTILVAFVLFFFMFSRYEHHVILDDDKLNLYSLPVTYYLMMGLQGNGTYNSDDEWINCAGFTKAERTASTISVIKSRLDEMGVKGYLKLLHRKTVRSFGCSDYDINYMLNMGPENPNRPIYKFVSADGKYFYLYQYESQAVYVSFYLLALIGAIFALVKKSSTILSHFAPFLALSGFYIFMLLWESNHRQLVNQTPLFVIVASIGAGYLADIIISKKKALATKQSSNA